jgi:hypothetical protein
MRLEYRCLIGAISRHTLVLSARASRSQTRYRAAPPRGKLRTPSLTCVGTTRLFMTPGVGLILTAVMLAEPSRAVAATTPDIQVQTVAPQKAPPSHVGSASPSMILASKTIIGRKYTGSQNGVYCVARNSRYPNGSTIECTVPPGPSNVCPIGPTLKSWICSDGQWILTR